MSPRNREATSLHRPLSRRWTGNKIKSLLSRRRPRVCALSLPPAFHIYHGST